MPRPLDRRSFLALAALSAPVALVGCTALQGSNAASPTGGAPTSTAGRGAAVEKPDLIIGALQILGSIPVTLGLEQGLFRDAGLNVSIVPLQSGALSLPALVAGEYDIMFSNYVTPIAASVQGIDTVVVAESSRSQPNNFGVVAMPDSPLTVPADLVGRTIGVNARNNVATLTSSSVLSVNGVAPDQVEFVEIPFPQMATALEARQVDAGFLPEPFLTTAKRNLGVKTIFDPCSGPTADLPMDGWIATRQFAQDNPNTIAAFRAALGQAQQRAADRAVLEPLLVSAARVDPAVAPLLSASLYPTSTNVTAIQRVADLMQQFQAIPAPVDVTPLVLP